MPTCRSVKSVSPATVLVGQQATFTVMVSNAGPARATGLVVQDLLPGRPDVRFGLAVAGQLRGGDGGVDHGDAAERGQSATLTLVATLAVAGAVTNLALVIAQGPARSRGEQQRGGGGGERRRRRPTSP